jgi:hypothetical protein
MAGPVGALISLHDEFVAVHWILAAAPWKEQSDDREGNARSGHSPWMA